MIDDVAKQIHADDYARHISNTQKRKTIREAEIKNLDVSMAGTSSTLGERITSTPSPNGVFNAVLRLEGMRKRYSEDLAKYAEELDRFYRDLDYLAPEEALVITRHYLEGAEYHEIADELHYSERTIFRMRASGLVTLYDVMPEHWRRATPDAAEVGSPCQLRPS